MYLCTPAADSQFPAGERPPRIYAYPRLRSPIHLLFIAWNPPRPYGGFWSLDRADTLRSELKSILQALTLIQRSGTEACFLDECLERGYYLIHAVKCWTDSRFPGFGRGRKRGDRTSLGEPLLRACVRTHLLDELDRLQPKRVVALGELPYLALRTRFPQLDPSFRPTEGTTFPPDRYALPWPLLYTCLPIPNPVPGSADRLPDPRSTPKTGHRSTPQNRP